MTERLVTWREALGRRFHFEPAVTADPRDVQRVDRELAARRTRYMKELRAAIIALEKRINAIADDDKVMRMHAHTAALEGGKVRLQRDARWLDEFRCEVLAFPKGKHDDQVDALSQLMTWAQERRKRTHGIHHLRWLS